MEEDSGNESFEMALAALEAFLEEEERVARRARDGAVGFRDSGEAEQGSEGRQEGRTGMGGSGEGVREDGGEERGDVRLTHLRGAMRALQQSLPDSLQLGLKMLQLDMGF